MGKMTSYKRPDGKSVNGYLAEPAQGAKAPGMVVIQEWWGLTDQIKGVADKLAKAGYRALVPDLYRGKVALEANEAKHLMEGLNFGDAAGQDIRGAVQYLKKDSPKVGVTGFCMGGKYTFLAAARCSGIAAAVPWYGMLRANALDAANPEHALDVVADFRCPILAFFGAEDALIPQHDVGELRQRAQQTGRDLDAVVYTDAGHAFANESRPEAYRPEAADDAWRRALAFFATKLEA